MADVTPERLADCIEVARQEAESFAAHGHGRTRIKADTLAALRELADLREQVRWRPIEKAPKNQRILIAVRGERMLASWQGPLDGIERPIGWRSGIFVYPDSYISGWMPLPEIGPLPGGDV